jgi:hypothetical protein
MGSAELWRITFYREGLSAAIKINNHLLISIPCCPAGAGRLAIFNLRRFFAWNIPRHSAIVVHRHKNNMRKADR